MEPFCDITDTLLSGGEVSLLSMPFDVIVDIHALRRSGLSIYIIKTNLTAVEVREIYVTITTTPTEAVFCCIAPLEDESRPLTMSNIRIKFEKRKRAMTPDETYKKRILELTGLCMTEQQCAGVMLYGDIYASLYELRNHGITINAPDKEVARVCICHFATLLDNPSSFDVYRNRHVELNGGSPSDKVCAACWAVGDFKECQTCKMGIYTCSTGCFMSCHFDLCKNIMRLPLEKRTPSAIKSLQMCQAVQFMETGEPDVFRAFSKPMLTRICAVCGAPAKSKCNTCMKSYYCSKACQTLAYPMHKRLHH